jgi:branched-subunit amino acid ABC-type transport system permease component
MTKFVTDFKDSIVPKILQHQLKIVTILVIFPFLLFTFNGIQNSHFSFNLVQIFFSSLYLASLYLCISLGLSMTYKLMGFANFAHAEYFVLGAYIGVAWSLVFADRKPQSIDLIIVLLLAFTITGLCAIIGDLLVFEPLRKMSSSPEAMMISSIGWGIIIRNVISIFFGGRSSYYDMVKLSPRVLSTVRIGSQNGSGFLNIETTDYTLRMAYVISIILTIIFVSTLFLFLEKTKTGKALRATSDNLQLAESSGINTTKMIRLTWFIGGGIAGIAGIIFVLTLPVIPYSGFLFLLPAFAVVVLGGVGSLKGSVYAGIIIAFAQTISITYLAGLEDVLLENFNVHRDRLSSYQIVVPFILLIGVILVRPSGLYGEDTSG